MIRTLWLVPALALIAACSAEKQEPQPKAGAAPTLHEMMVQKIDVDADAIWAIGNAAIDDKASIDPAKMTGTTWQELDRASQRMTGHARELGALDPIVVTRPGVKVADEGTPGAPSPAQIQAHLRRDTDLYRSLAGSLEQHASEGASGLRGRGGTDGGPQLVGRQPVGRGVGLRAGGEDGGGRGVSRGHGPVLVPQGVITGGVPEP